MSIRTIARETRTISQAGDFFGSLNYFLRSVVGIREPVRVKVLKSDVFIRPTTSDFDVAKECQAGEFVEAIKAATPLKYNFIVDAGGYIGTAAIELALAFPDAKIVTLEPSKENFAVLLRNVGRHKNIVALNKALGAEPGTINLINRGTGHWGFSIVQRPADCATPSVLQETEVTTITALMQEFDASGIDILKLDVEGAEHGIMSASSPWLDKIRVLFAELHERISPGVEATFASVTAKRANSRSGEKILSALT